MSNNFYRIDLEPLSPFFFGKERKAEMGNRQNYFTHSADFPQQTALLGFMRHQLLLQEGLIPIKGKGPQVQELIGESSFQNKPGQKFGRIQQLSPVFLSNSERPETPLFLRDKEVVKVKENNDNGNLSWKEHSLHVNTESNQVKLQLDNGKDYKAKDDFLPKLADYNQNNLTTDNNNVIQQENIYHTHQQVGIEKSEKTEAYFIKRNKELGETSKVCPSNGKVKNNFNRKVLKKNWRFSFYVMLNEDEHFAFNTEPRFAFLGADRSCFKMTIQPINDQPAVFSVPFNSESTAQVMKIVLLSDAHVLDGGQLYQHCLLANTETTQFRHFNTSVSNTKNYYDRHIGDHLYNLLKRGSVLYVDREQYPSVRDMLMGVGKPDHPSQLEPFRKIGYNYFITLPE